MNAEADIKWCEDALDELKKMKTDIINQTEDIAKLLAVVDEVFEAVRKKKLPLEKLVKSEKENRKNEIFAETQSEFAKYVEVLNKELKYKLLGSIPGIDAAGKNKKLLSSVETACKKMLVDACQEASAKAAKTKALS